MVSAKLSLDGSPEQISGWLKRRYPGNQKMQISHEAIYRSLFVQAGGVLKKELVAQLRTRRMMRRSKQASTHGQLRGQIVDAVSIRERPPEIEDRAIPGHWEGDLIAGSSHTHIATLAATRAAAAHGLLLREHAIAEQRLTIGEPATEPPASQPGVGMRAEPRERPRPRLRPSRH